MQSARLVGPNIALCLSVCLCVRAISTAPLPLYDVMGGGGRGGGKEALNLHAL